MDGVWVEKFSRTHKKKYYFNTQTKETSWVNPVENHVASEKIEKVKTIQTLNVTIDKVVTNETVHGVNSTIDTTRQTSQNDKETITQFTAQFTAQSSAKSTAQSTPQFTEQSTTQLTSQLTEQSTTQSQKRVNELSLMEFLMDCLKNEVSMEFDWESRYSTSDSDPNPKNKKIFSYYLVTNVPYLVKEIQYDYGVVALLSITDTHLPISHEILNKLCGFKPFYEFNLSSFAAFLGVQTSYAMSPWRQAVWRTVYKPIFEQMKLPNADSWAKLSRVRVTLCTSAENPGGYLFVRELQEFLKYVSNIR